ncbi:MAG: HAD-IA family hydrolase, partial [Cyanobacteria bacterium P01_H01_bin.130]
ATYVAAQGYGWSEALAIAQTAFAAVDQALGPKAPLTPPFPEVLAGLERLAAAGLKLGIVSADAPPGVAEFVDFYELRSLCPVALGSTQACLKPDPCLLQKACQLLGVEPQEVLVVGDASSDVALARRGKSAGVVILRRAPALHDHDFGADAYGQTLGALQVVNGTTSTPC